MRTYPSPAGRLLRRSSRWAVTLLFLYLALGLEVQVTRDVAADGTESRHFALVFQAASVWSRSCALK